MTVANVDCRYWNKCEEIRSSNASTSNGPPDSIEATTSAPAANETPIEPCTGGNDHDTDKVTDLEKTDNRIVNTVQPSVCSCRTSTIGNGSKVFAETEAATELCAGNAVEGVLVI